MGNRCYGDPLPRTMVSHEPPSSVDPERRPGARAALRALLWWESLARPWRIALVVGFLALDAVVVVVVVSAVLAMRPSSAASSGSPDAAPSERSPDAAPSEPSPPKTSGPPGWDCERPIPQVTDRRIVFECWSQGGLTGRCAGGRLYEDGHAEALKTCDPDGTWTPSTLPRDTAERLLQLANQVAPHDECRDTYTAADGGLSWTRMHGKGTRPVTLKERLELRRVAGRF